MRHNRSGRTEPPGWWLIALLSVGGCQPSDPCDPGQYEEHGLCHFAPVDAAGVDAGHGDAGDDKDSGDTTDANADPFAGFGNACTQQSECTGFGLVCGESFLPYCTRTNCMGLPNGCPPDWTCLNTGGAGPDPTVTSVCLKP